ncbi:MAG TPA: DUF1491 family protein [Hypericibacter adhaerens]|uniref:GTP-binding protein Era n=1 Tax=Hypericibacter adhaerens TaxID=2602016 RepID=A0A5J6N8T2_9PROT|nr:DUF1491 family protein [Hypericibacter adhaerens]QEX23746.1 hypothetical protein FRZ61_36850 [Hypericibacter adhaerens]HWA43363.1 DUF1491 family protein [Hypericibacter adhaerens]
MEERVPTVIWVTAQMRQGHADGMPVFLRRRGEPRAGAVLVKIDLLGPGCKVMTQVRDGMGRLGWLSALGEAPVTEAEAEAYIERAVKRDPDLWVVEVESRDGRHPFQTVGS